MQVDIFKMESGKFQILKWLIFETRQPIKAVERVFIPGENLSIDCPVAAAFHTAKKAVRYLFERFPGTSVLYMVWSDEKGFSGQCSSL